MVDKRRSRTSLLKHTINFECDDYEWDSDYSNQRNEMVIVLYLYEGHRDVIFE